MARTDTLPHFLTDLADSIRQKTGETGKISPDNMDVVVKSIPSGESGFLDNSATFTTITTSNKITSYIKKVPKINTTSMNNLTAFFRDCKNLEEFDASDFVTSEANYISEMFSGCSKLNKVDISNWNVTNIQTASKVFYLCSNLTSLDLSNLSFDNATDVQYLVADCNKLASVNFDNTRFKKQCTCSYMFEYCYALENVDYSKDGCFVFDNIVGVSSWFRNCTKLKVLKIPNVNSTALNTIQYFCYGCTQLQTLDVRGLTFSTASNKTSFMTNVPNTCEIIVKDATEKAWFNTNYSRFTNVHIVPGY